MAIAPVTMRHWAPWLIPVVSVAAGIVWFDFMPEIASILLAIVGVGALVPDLQNAIDSKMRSILFVTLCMVGILGVISNAMQRQRDIAMLLGEIAGGRSFCYVDFGGTSDGKGLFAHLMQFGKYPVYDVSVTITEIDAMNADLESAKPLDFTKYRHTYPASPVVGRHSLWRPLDVFESRDYRKFLVEIRFRTGALTELVRVKRLPNGGHAVALIAAGSFFVID